MRKPPALADIDVLDGGVIPALMNRKSRLAAAPKTKARANDAASKTPETTPEVAPEM